MLPALIIHADWSSDPKKRWMCAATLDAGVYRLAMPVQVESTANLVRMAAQLAKGGGTVLGFDFPIGVPRAYARLAGISRFLDLLPELGLGEWREFFKIAERPDDASIRRPFYPARPGGTLQEHLVTGLGVSSIDDLLRRCDFGNGDRNKACALFWTLGGNQVGRAALAGWRDMLLPAMRELQGELGVWPFDGDLQSLLASRAAVIVETYPGNACVQLGLGAPGRGWSKRDRSDRVEKGRGIQRCALQMRADLRQIEGVVTDGFGASDVGEDQFDAVVGLLGMLAVILGLQVDGAPKDDAVTSVEGWIFGQRSTVALWAS
jgi:hypothetical protein